MLASTIQFTNTPRPPRHHTPATSTPPRHPTPPPREQTPGTEQTSSEPEPVWRASAHTARDNNHPANRRAPRPYKTRRTPPPHSGRGAGPVPSGPNSVPTPHTPAPGRPRTGGHRDAEQDRGLPVTFPPMSTARHHIRVPRRPGPPQRARRRAQGAGAP